MRDIWWFLIMFIISLADTHSFDKMGDINPQHVIVFQDDVSLKLFHLLREAVKQDSSSVLSSVKRGAWETQPGHRACNPIIIPWKHLWGPASTPPPFVLHWPQYYSFTERLRIFGALLLLLLLISEHARGAELLSQDHTAIAKQNEDCNPCQVNSSRPPRLPPLHPETCWSWAVPLQ